MNEETLKFIVWITGHDEETIKQMYNDYSSSPQAKSIPMQLPVKPNFADGLQEGIDYCQTQIDRLNEIYKDDPMYGLNAIQKYIDVRDHLKSKISV